MIIEEIRHADIDGGEGVMALIVRREAGYSEGGPHYVTKPDTAQQVAVMRHCAGTKLRSHFHPPHERANRTTPETLVVMKGLMRVLFFSGTGTQVDSRVVSQGDVVVLLRGGHGFEMMSEVELVEVRPGPYPGPALDKIFIKE